VAVKSNMGLMDNKLKWRPIKAWNFTCQSEIRDRDPQTESPSVIDSPYAYRIKSAWFQILFFSGEGSEPPHIHIEHGDKLAKYW
jgi:hypothetical protein